MTTFAPYARILRSPAYRALWLGQIVSNVGDTLHDVARVLLFRLTVSGAAPAALSLAQIVVGLVLGPLAGVLVDRLDRRAVVLAADLLRAGLAAALAVTAQAPLAIAFAVGIAAAGVPFRPAAQALVPSLVDGGDLQAANSVAWSTEQTAQMVASALAALLAAWGATPATLVNAASFVFSAATLFSFPRLPQRGTIPPRPARAGVLAHFWHDARDGLG